MVPELYQQQGRIIGIAYLYQNLPPAASGKGKSYSFPGLQRIQQVDYQPERDFDSLVQMDYTRLRGAKAPWPSQAQIAWMLRTGQLTPRIQHWLREKGIDPDQFRESGFTYEQMRDEMQQLSRRTVSHCGVSSRKQST